MEISEMDLNKQTDSLLNGLDELFSGHHPTAVLNALSRSTAVYISWASKSRIHSSKILMNVISATGEHIDVVFENVQEIKKNGDEVA